MSDKQTNVLIVLVVAVVAYYFMFMCPKTKLVNEHMSPLNHPQNNFVNNYPRGRCNMKSYEKSSCSVGNCPLESPISNKQFCDIQCAQGVGREDRDKCYNVCMKQMNNGCR